MNLPRLTRCLLVGLLLCVPIWGPVGCDFSQVGCAGPFNRKEMESLVSQVRLQTFSGDEEYQWNMVAGAAKLFPKSTPVTTGSRPDGMVYASRNAEGKLTVVIMTEWGSHMTNQAGFAYYDEPPAKTTHADGFTFLAVPGDLNSPTSEDTIDAHWREVYDPSH